MEQHPERELTTTLHLGVRDNGESGSTSLIESLLEGSSEEERSVLDEILNGGPDRAMVLIHKGPSRGARFLITSEGVSIGRASESDIFLDDVTVSRAHARITHEGDRFLFTDLGSLNGSYINNQQSQSHRLNNGDEIQIGKFHLIFICSKSTQGEK